MNMEYNDNDEELKFVASRIVERNSSSIRNSKVNLRIDLTKTTFDDSDTQFDRRIDGNKSNYSDNRIVGLNDDCPQTNDVDTISPPHVHSARTPSIDEAIMQCMMSFDDITDTNSPQSSDNENTLDDMDGIPVRTGMRSKSVEDLLSVMKIDDDRCHLLDNFKQILNHESRHLILLNTISKFKYILKESKVTDKVLTSIFYNIDDLIETQNNLVICLENMIADWHLKKPLFTDIMDLYILLHMRCKEYVKNIAHAVTELRLLFEKNEKFSEAMKVVVYEGSSFQLEVLLAKPTNWLCNSLENIKNLIEAAEGECNLKMVKETLEKLKDNSELKIKSPHNVTEKNIFIRRGMFIEILPNDLRQLRHVFLFSGMLICAKQKVQTGGNNLSKFQSFSSIDTRDSSKRLRETTKPVDQFEAKWFITIQNLILQTKMVENCEKRKTEIAILKDKIRDLRMQLIIEKTKVPENFSFRKMVIKKDSERIQNQIMKAQTELMQLSPTPSLLVSNLTEKPHNLLVFSIKDLEIWKRDINQLKKDQNTMDTSMNTLATATHLLDSYKLFSDIKEVANVPLLKNINDEGITGEAVIVIESVDGLNPVYSYYLSIEVDSFYLNEVKAITKKLTDSSTLSWNESFDIELDCSHTMNILLYQVKNYAEDKESLLGYFEFKLDVNDLDNKTLTQTTPIFGEDSTLLQITVSCKIKIVNRPVLEREPSMMKTTLFGIPLRSIIAREKGKCHLPMENVPLILYACLKKIEEEGINEEGIYRISGNKYVISEFYKRLNKNVINAIKEIDNYDLHTITGIVKLYLRELPEPLMMTENHSHLIEISKMGDSDERNRLYTEVIRLLPEPNHSTVVYILKHLQRVCEHSNKNHMVASNLGLIIGPTLMLTPTKTDNQDYTYLVSETRNSMYHSKVFTQILIGICSGVVILDHP